MVEQSNDNGNGRITLAIIGQKLDEVNRRLERIERCMDEQDRRIQLLDQSTVRLDEQIRSVRNNAEACQEDIEQLKASDKRFGLIGVVAGAVAGVLTGWLRP